MNDFEREVRQLWDNGYLVPEIAVMYGVGEDEIENIVEDPSNYDIEPQKLKEE